MKRGEIWWARLSPPMGSRPVLLVSRDDAYSRRQLVMAAPVTTRIRGITAEVLLGPDEGLPRRSAANIDTLFTTNKDLLERLIGELSIPKMVALDHALRYALGLD